jgi:hypothetical protein
MIYVGSYITHTRMTVSALPTMALIISLAIAKIVRNATILIV